MSLHLKEWGKDQQHCFLFVNCRAGRIVACMTSIISLLAIIFRRHQGMHWAVLGLFVDFLIRLVAGPGPSVLTQLARLFLARMKPQFTYG